MMIVLRSFEKLSINKNLGLKLFHDPPIDGTKLDIVRKAFGTQAGSSGQFRAGEMCDLLVIAHDVILLVEVKASINTAKAALDLKKHKKELNQQPLAQGVNFLHSILECLKITCHQLIRQIIVVPNDSGDNVRRKLPRRSEYIYFGKDDLENLDDKWSILTSNQHQHHLTVENVQHLILALVTLGVATMSKKAVGELASDETAINIERAIHEGKKGITISTQITKQESLRQLFEKQEAQNQKSTLRGDHVIVSVNDKADLRAMVNEVIFFTPEQARVIYHVTNPKHIIFGPAATGKTLLIQAKALQLLLAGQSVVVLLPEATVELYKYFFARNVSQIDQGRVLVLSLERPGDLSKLRDAISNGYHLLIDEYFALISTVSTPVYKHAEKDLYEVISGLPPNRLCWIVVDPLQPVSEKNFAPDLHIPGMQLATTSFLLTVQRCTSNVYTQWRKHCGRFVTLGHQYEGLYTEMHVVPAYEEYTTTVDAVCGWISTAAKRELDKGWRPKDLVILIDDKFLGTSGGWKEVADLWENMKKQLKIRPLTGEVGVADDSVEMDFMSGYGKIHSYEWPIVICARLNNDYDEFCDYVVRSRAIFKLVILQCPVTEKPKDLNASSKSEDSDDFMLTMNRQLYTSFYDLMACQEFLQRCPDAVTDDEVQETIVKPLCWIAETFTFFTCTHLLHPILDELEDVIDSNLKQSITQITEALDMHLIRPPNLCDSNAVENCISYRRACQLLLQDLFDYALENSPQNISSHDDWLTSYFWSERAVYRFYENIFTKLCYWAPCANQVLGLARDHKPSVYEKIHTSVQFLAANENAAVCLPLQFSETNTIEEFKTVCHKLICGLLNIAYTEMQGIQMSNQDK